MFNPFMFVYAFLLFFVLTPGVLLSLPPKSGKITVALTHALVFALIWVFTHKMVWRATHGLFEGMAHKEKMTTLKEEMNKKPLY
jgi:hypothetical protein